MLSKVPRVNHSHSCPYPHFNIHLDLWDDGGTDDFLQLLHYFPFGFLQCQFLLTSLWGAQVSNLATDAPRVQFFGPIFQMWVLFSAWNGSFISVILFESGPESRSVFLPAFGSADARPRENSRSFLCICRGLLCPGMQPPLWACLVCWKSWITHSWKLVPSEESVHLMLWFHLG